MSAHRYGPLLFLNLSNVEPRFYLLSGKAPYRAVHTSPSADRYADSPLPGGTVKIGRWQSIEGEIRKRRRRGEHTFTSSPCRPSPTGDSFSLRREKDRGDVVDISRIEYEPSDIDILYADGITSSDGLAYTEFHFPPLSCAGSSIDDDDQLDPLFRYQLIRVHSKVLGENCKWLDMFDDVQIVVFCVAITDYDEYYEDSNGVVTNKMMESRRLFECIASHPTFEQKDVLLILSKFDLLEQKIDMSPLTSCEWFADYSPIVSRHPESKTSRGVPIGATKAQQAFQYIAVKFKRLFFSMTGRKLYVVQANGLDSDSVDAALRYAREIIKWEEDRFAGGTLESMYSTEPSSFSH
ncbi:hypothetical protein BHE74_00013824 [Ensete ventricosum]|nr:hypothetical protein BHE74_00013824 [Ensete ventricosum]